MDMMKLMAARHSVRQYENKGIESAKRAVLDEMVKALNEESGLHIQIMYDEPTCFDSFMAHYGKFSGVKNYIAIVGKKSADLDVQAGYYGEKLVLKAQELGLSTCWVAMTHGKSLAKVEKGEKLAILISLGYGANQGSVHKSKDVKDVSQTDTDAPDWFRRGMEAALLAPTAMNQQKFMFTLKDGRVTAKATGGFYSKIDLGIVRCHFELASGHEVRV